MPRCILSYSKIRISERKTKKNVFIFLPNGSIFDEVIDSEKLIGWSEKTKYHSK